MADLYRCAVVSHVVCRYSRDYTPGIFFIQFNTDQPWRRLTFSAIIF